MTTSKLCTSCLPCCQSFTISDYINRTTVLTYLTTGDATIPPYPRPNGFESGDPVTDGSCPGGPGTDYPACGQWPITDIPSTAGLYLLSNDQLFELSADPAVTTVICPGPGEKVAQTTKRHHGRLPFGFCADGCTAITSRYRGVDRHVSASYTVTEYDTDGTTVISGPITITDEIQRAGTVSDTSGQRTMDACINFGGAFDGITGFKSKILQCFGIDYACLVTVPSGIDPISNPPESYADWDAFDASVNWNDTHDDVGPPTHIEISTVFSSRTATTLTGTYKRESWSYHSDDGVTPGTLDVHEVFTVDFTIALSSEYTSAQVYAHAKSAESYWNFKNHALFPFSESFLRTVGVIAAYRELGAANPDRGLEEPCTMDDYTSPTMGSGTTMDPYTAWEQIDWYDVGAYVWITDDHICDQAHEIATEHRLIYDGSIIGAPFTPGGIGVAAGLPDHNFSWTHITWGCYVPDGFPYTTEARFYGAYAGEDATGFDATDLKIPKSASLWTDQLLASLYYAGSWTMWDADRSSLTLQKQCESAVKFDAYNLYGPYGYWRHEMAYKISTCITATTGTAAWATGDTLTFSGDDLCNVSRTDGHIAAGDKVVLGESGGSFKIFTVASVSANNLVLGAEDTDRRNIADCYSMWTNASPVVPTGDFGFIGKLFDWKRSGVSFVPPAILGKVAATVAQDIDEPTKVKVTFPQKYTQVGDKIIFVQADAADTVNNDNSGSGFTLTDVDDAFCKFTGTYDGATMKGMVKTLGAPLAKWNSIKSRRTFYWSYCSCNDSTGGFNDPVNTDDTHHGVNTTLGCTPNNPNDTVASEWKTTGYPDGGGFPFPTASASTCGGKAWVGVTQDMRHPLVQSPFCCGTTDECTGFGVCLPRVEAFTQTQMDAWVADGAPALPDGITLDVMTSPPIPAGDSCTEPHYLPNGIHAPWSQCTSPWIR